MKEVKRAGEIIAGELPWNDETAPQIRDAFHIANNWRDAYAYPMLSLRYSLMWFMRHHNLEGVTVARLKRMQAIRRKLRRIPHNLSQLQDLGGAPSGKTQALFGRKATTDPVCSLSLIATSMALASAGWSNGFDMRGKVERTPRGSSA
jgi:hypothetical protein